MSLTRKRLGAGPPLDLRMAGSVLALIALACEHPQPPASCTAIPQQTIAVGQSGTVDACFNDPNGDLLRYGAVSSNPGVAVASVASSTVTITAVAPGNTSVTVTATDPDGMKGQESFHVMVPNRAPTAIGTIAAQTIIAGHNATVDLSLYFNEPDGQTLTYSAMAEERTVATPAVTGSVLTITGVARGITDLTATATDPGGLTAIQGFRVAVPNRAPVVVGPISGQTLESGDSVALELSPHFDDPDGDSLNYFASATDPRVAMATVRGSILEIVGGTRGTTEVLVTARDPEGMTVDQSFLVTIPNRRPVSSALFPPQTVNAGETIRLGLSAYFSDPDGDALTYEAVSSDPAIAAVSVHDPVVSIAGVADGDVTVTVVATDPGGLHVQSSFRVDVIGNSDVGRFHLELVFATEMTKTQEGAFRDASERWMSILTDSDLPDVTVNETVDCAGEYGQSVASIDDLIIVAAVVEIDGPFGVLGRAGPCWIRREPSLPYFGMMEFDLADLEWMERDGVLESVVLHEMGHVLGIGTLWQHLDLLSNPSLAAGREVDTYLPLPLAVEAFDQAGGVGYTEGGKVPVENQGDRPGSDDGHWRASVLGTELMTPSINPGEDTSPLSVITIQSLADLGYTVDVSLADPYRLPSAAALQLLLANSIDLANDIIAVPMVVTDRNGRVVRVIPPV